MDYGVPGRSGPRVSRLCLGAMTFRAGDAPSADKERLQGSARHTLSRRQGTSVTDLTTIAAALWADDIGSLSDKLGQKD